MMVYDILLVAQSMGEDLLAVGALDDITMRRLNLLCLPPKRTFTSEAIKRIRKSNRLSQAVFAAALGIDKSTVQQWEQGLKKPSGAALRLLDIVERKGIGALR